MTIFAGVPDADVAAPDWDRRAGFASAAVAMRTRREEDQEALARLDAIPVWLDLFDSQYGVPAGKDEIAARLQPVLERFADAAVAAPLGLFHSDHVLARQAALALWRPSRERRSWLFYEDALYRRLAGLVQERLAAWRDEGIVALPVNLHRPEFAASKADAVRAYASQIQLFDRDKLTDLAAPEGFWQLQCDSVR